MAYQGKRTWQWPCGRPLRDAAVEMPAQGQELDFQLVHAQVLDGFPQAEPVYDCSALQGQAYEGVSSEEHEQLGGDKEVAVLLYGVTASGHSVLVRVSGFEPFLYYSLERHTQQQVVQALAEQLGKSTEERLLQSSRVVHAKRLYHWQARPSPWLKLFVWSLAKYRWLSSRVCSDRTGQVPHEGRVSLEHKFLDMTSLQLCGWVRLRQWRPCGDAVSHCQVEVTCHMAHVQALAEEQRPPAPLLVACLDIECNSSRATDTQQPMPCATVEGDCVVGVGVHFWRLGGPCADGTCHDLRVYFSNGDCGPCGEGIETVVCDDEAHMLGELRDALALQCVDVVVGHNIFGFDLEYLWKRYEMLQSQVPRFACLGKLVRVPAKFAQRNLSSNALGDNLLSNLVMPGCITADTYQYSRGVFKCDSYKLQALAEEFLQSAKEDMPYGELFRLAREGGPEGRARIGSYCVQDCVLVSQLCHKWNMLVTLMQRSFVTKTPLMDLGAGCGQQIQVWNQIVWHCHRMAVVAINHPEKGGATQSQEEEEGEGYEGATVIEPQVGFYGQGQPVATLDFASLYPSIMMTYNLCYSTLIKPNSCSDQQLAEAELKGLVHTYDLGGGKRASFRCDAPGVLPQILKLLVDERKRVKRLMQGETDPSTKAMLNATQLAIKVSANSVYGFTGAASKGRYPCQWVAASVTRKGRQLIDLSKELVEANWNATVVYGDTDSIMVRFHDCSSVEQAANTGEQAARFITEKLGHPTTLKIEFECVKHPFLLLKKKRYVAREYEPGDTEGHVCAKGIQMVRRDSCHFTRTVQRAVLDTLLHSGSVQQMIAALRVHMQRLVADQVPLEDFVQSSQLRTGYKNAQLPHVVVAEKMRARDPNSAPRSGERVRFVYIQSPTGTRPGSGRASDRAEDPDYAKSKGLKPDRLYYLTNGVAKALHDVLAIVGCDTQAIFADAIRQLELQRDRQGSLLQHFAPVPGSKRSGTSDLSKQLLMGAKKSR